MSKFKIGDKVKFFIHNTKIQIRGTIQNSWNDGVRILYSVCPDNGLYNSIHNESYLELIENEKPQGLKAWLPEVNVGDEKPQGFESVAALAYSPGYIENAILDATEVLLTKLNKTCECGKEKHSFASHSNWCPKHE